jgi:hypothetical protein
MPMIEAGCCRRGEVRVAFHSSPARALGEAVEIRAGSEGFFAEEMTV